MNTNRETMRSKHQPEGRGPHRAGPGRHQVVTVPQVDNTAIRQTQTATGTPSLTKKISGFPIEITGNVLPLQYHPHSTNDHIVDDADVSPEKWWPPGCIFLDLDDLVLVVDGSDTPPPS